MDSEVCSHIARWFLVIVCYHACTIRADDGDEFSNNLFSDLAPLLALFGEQVAKQYLSQSLSWLDCVIFAMAPLGIITAIVSAIRVAGPTWLRAVIGRARESKGDAELELMSSTSIDVCELWNGKSVVRAIGESDIIEIFWLEKIDPLSSDPRTLPPTKSPRRLFWELWTRLFSANESRTVGTIESSEWKESKGTIFSAQEAKSYEFLYQSRRLVGDETTTGQTGATPAPKLGQTDRDPERQDSTEEPDPPSQPNKSKKPNPPNLSLNILGDPTSRLELVLVAFTTTILQLGVIAFQITITYLSPLNEGFMKGGNPPPDYACPLNVAGTLLVVIGMFICAMVVQLKSKEHTLYFDDENASRRGYRLRMAWIQRNQRVMDQRFDSYCLYPPETRRKAVYSKFNDRSDYQNPWTIIGTLVSVVGFVLQFTGLRGMNYLASLVQLGAIGIATLLRVTIRRHLNNVPKIKEIKAGYELDSMAKDLTGCSGWEITNLISTSHNSKEEFEGDQGTFDARLKLQKISDWPLENMTIKKNADSLVRAIQDVAQYLHRSDIILKGDAQNETSFEFRLPVTYNSSSTQPATRESKNGAINIVIKTSISDAGGAWAYWKIDREEIEAVLTLWASSQEKEEATSGPTGDGLILLGPRSEFNILDYEMFISYETPCLKLENGLDDLKKTGLGISQSRVFGYVGTNKTEEHLAFKTTADVSSLHARHVLTCCLNQLFGKIDDLKGQTRWYRGVSVSNTSDTPTLVPDPVIQLRNSHLDAIFDILHNSGIDGTRQELLMLLVPTLQRNGNLLRIFDAFFQVIKEAKVAESTNAQPQVSMEEVFRIFIHAVRTFRTSSHWLYVGDTLFGLLQVCRSVFGNKHKWTKSAHSLVSQVCHSIEGQIYYEIRFRNGGDYDGQYWLKACLGLVNRCREALGDDSPEHHTLQRLLVQAESLEAASPVSILTLAEATVVSATEGYPKAAAVEQSCNRVELPADIADEKRATAPVLKSTSTPNQFQGYPEQIWRVVSAEHPEKLCNDISRAYEGGERVGLVSQVLNAAADLGRSRVVVFCITELLDAFSRTVLPIENLEDTLVKAASSAIENKNAAIIDLMLSTLDGDKTGVLNKEVAKSGLNYQQKFFNGSLQLACERGATEIVHLLLSAGLDPRLHGDFDSRPLYLAARGGFTDIITLLFFYGVLPMSEEPDGKYTFLHYAARHGAKRTLDLVISPNLSLLWLLFTQDGKGKYPLENAIIHGHESFAIQAFEAMVKYRQMYSWDPELDTERSHGQSPLHLACTHDFPDLAKVLINYGFQPRVIDEAGNSAFQIAAISGSCNVGKILLGYDKNQAISQNTDLSPMLLAVSNDQADYVKLLLENGADIEAQDPTTGYTPLLAAAIDGKAKTIKFLIEQGASTLAEDRIGRTFMQLAMMSGALDALDIVFDKPETSKELLNRTLLLAAIGSDHPKMNLLWIWKRINGNIESLHDLLPGGEEGQNSFYTLLQNFMVSRLNRAEKALTDLFFKPYTDEMNLLLPKPPADVSWGFSKQSAQNFADRISLLTLFQGDDPSVTAGVLDERSNALLVYAAGTGSEDACKRLLRYMKSDLHKEQLERALHLAFYGGRLNIVKILVDAGIQTKIPFQGLPFVTSGNKISLTPLSLLLRIAAVTRKNHGSWWEALSVDDNFDIGPAPWENDFDLLGCLDLFIHHGVETTPTIEELKTEQSILHLAIMCKSPKVFAALINAGADINLPLQAKRPLLHFALSYEFGDPSWIPVLCSYGIDINAVDKDGKTALIIEIEKSKASTTNILIENGATWGRGGKFKAPELIEAIKLGGSSLFSLLCKRHKRVKPEEYQNCINTRGAYGSSPVHVAAKHHNDGILEFLWLEGADMHAKDKQGRNALSYALESQSTMQLLVKLCRINPNERLTEKDYTAAHIAVRTIQDPAQIAKTLQDLWNLGADFNIKDKVGKTPVDYVGFASRRPKFPIRSVVSPNKSLKVEWAENTELCRQVGEAFDEYRLGSGGYLVKERPTVVCRSGLVIPVD